MKNARSQLGMRRACAFASFVAAIMSLNGGSTPASAEDRGEIPVLIQVTRNTTGTVADARLRSELGSWISFTSNGDVMGPGTQTSGREVYLYNVFTGTTTRVTTTPGGQSYDATRVTDATFAGGRPDSIAFVSTGDFDPNGDNSDGNPEIFIYEVASGEFHQITDTQPPVVNSMPYGSDSGKCWVFTSTGNLDTNDGSVNPDNNPGTGFKNPDGSQEVFLFTVEDAAEFPHGYFTQVSNGPAGTTSSAPTIGGYWFPRQCQTTAFLSNHAQLGDGALGTHIYTFERTTAKLERMYNGGVSVYNNLAPDGIYGPPHISSASNFARGPFVVFSTDADVWNNGLTGLEQFRYRVFHPRMTQYSNLAAGDIYKPQISDGGAYIVFYSNGELLGEKRGAVNVGPGPFNADHNLEIFQTKGRRRVWQLTNTTGCANYDATTQDNGRGIAFVSTCDLVPGKNPTSVPQVFLFRRVNPDDPLLQPGVCKVVDGCCNESNGCYVDLRGRMDKPAARNRPS